MPSRRRWPLSKLKSPAATILFSLLRGLSSLLALGPLEELPYWWGVPTAEQLDDCVADSRPQGGPERRVRMKRPLTFLEPVQFSVFVSSLFRPRVAAACKAMEREIERDGLHWREWQLGSLWVGMSRTSGRNPLHGAYNERSDGVCSVW